MSEATDRAVAFVGENRDRVFASFAELLAFPSISADPERHPDIEACAAWIVAQLERIGFENCRVMPTNGRPVVYGDWLHAGSDAPTVLVYDHYDVQPVDPLEMWVSDPFAAEVRDGRLYARGVLDNKAGVWGNISAFEAMLATSGRLPVNVKLLFEGEEESGSPNMEAFLDEHLGLFSADVMINCDGRFGSEEPVTSYAGRGIVTGEVLVRGPKSDLHSGQFGGIVENPLHVAGRIAGALHDAEGRIRVPGYYDSVETIDEVERSRILGGWQPERAESHAGVPLTWGRRIAPDAERGSALPTLDINGIWGGYQGPGTKTVLPAEARMKFSSRLVPDQDPDVAARQIADYIESFSTPTVSVSVTIGERAWPFRLQTEGPYLEAVQQALEATIGRRATLIRSGGSIPILGMFNRRTGVPIIAFGYGEGEGMHSFNEYIGVDAFLVAIEAGIRMYHNLGDIDRR